MKIILLLLILFTSSYSLFAQWTPVNTGLPGETPTSMYGWFGVDAVWVGTDGGGVFKTTDNGANWTNINGDLANLYINDIRPFGTGNSMFVATDGGPFFTMDETTYTNCTTAGLTNTDINYFGFGGDDPADFTIGTNGGGIFTAPDWSGPWTAASGGLTGNGLIVNDLGGYSDNNVDYAVAATDGGVYFADSTLNPWTQKNNGLSGDALEVQNLAGLGSVVFIITHGGLYFSTDLGDNWAPLIPNERFTAGGLVQTLVSPIGMAVFVFGTNIGYYSVDFTNYIPIDMTGISGQVNCFALTSTNLFIGVDTGDRSGGVYSKPLGQIVGIEERAFTQAQQFTLEQNYPNPFNPETSISFQLPAGGFVSLKIYDVSGKEVGTLISKNLTAGNHTFKWNGSDFSSGVYVYRLKVDGKLAGTRRMLLLR